MSGPKTQTKTTQTQTDFSKTGASQGGAVVASGRGWFVTKREYNGRVFYDLRVRGTFDMAPAQVLREAIPAVQKLIAEGKIDAPVTYTQWIGKKTVRYLIMKDAVMVQINMWAGVGLLRRVMELVEAFTKASNGGGEDAEDVGEDS